MSQSGKFDILNHSLPATRGPLPDYEIERLCSKGDQNFDMIYPFIPRTRNAAGISGGLSFFGYDIHLGNQFISPIPAIWPQMAEAKKWTDKYSANKIILAPQGFILAETVEHFSIPWNVIGICQGKSSLARQGIGILVTPLEPGWHGILTLEIYNHSPHYVELESGQGIAQIIFFAGNVPNAEYSGKYQGAESVQIFEPKAKTDR